jgi:hypothetical protein
LNERRKNLTQVLPNVLNLKLLSSPSPLFVRVHLPPCAGVISGLRAATAVVESVPDENRGGRGIEEKKTGAAEFPLRVMSDCMALVVLDVVLERERSIYTAWREL